MTEFAPFPIQEDLTAIAIGIRNRRLIADQVFPIVPVGRKEFRYYKHTTSESFTIPNTLVGRKSKPDEIEFTATRETDSVEGHGLDDFVPQDDINNADNPFDPLGNATEMLTNLVLLAREKRVADMAFDAANYDTGLKETLAGTDQFDDYANSSPITVINDAADSCLMRPNIMTMGRTVFSTLRGHPDIVKAFNGTSGDTGLVPAAFLAQLFEMDAVYVGEGWYNSAKPGQTPNYVRVWGDKIALHFRDTGAARVNQMSYGCTFMQGTRIAGTIPQPERGLLGGQLVRVGEQVKEVVTASALGYLISDVLST